MLEIKGIQDTIKKLQNAAVAYQISVTEAKKNLAWTIFRDLVEHTPQWSGNLASNWYIEVGGAYSGTSHYKRASMYAEKLPPGKADPEPYSAGMDPAVSATLNRALGELDLDEFAAFKNTRNYGSLTSGAVSRIRWNSTIRIVNTTPYAEDVEAGVAPEGTKGIRDVNLFHGPNVPAHGVAMVQYVQNKYGSRYYLRPAMGGVYNNNAKIGPK